MAVRFDLAAAARRAVAARPAGAAAPFIAAPPHVRRQTVLDGLSALYGPRAAAPVALLERLWGVDPFSRCYIASYAPVT